MPETINEQVTRKVLLPGLNLARLRNLALMIVGGVILVYFAYQVAVGTLNSRATSSGTQAVSVAVKQLSALLDGWKAAADSLAENPRVREVIESSPSKEAADRRISSMLDQGGRAVLYPLDIEFVDPEPWPGPDYSSIALLLEAKSLQQTSSMGVVHLNSPDAGVAWATVITNPADDRITALLLVSYPFSAVSDYLDEWMSFSSYFDLRMNQRYRKGVVYFRGAPNEILPDDLKQIPVKGHNVSVAYMISPYLFTNGKDWWINGIGLLVGIGLLLIGQKLERTSDEAELTLKDLISNRQRDSDQSDPELEDALGFVEDGAMNAASEAAPAIDETVMDESIFRAYDIRGVIGKTLTASGAVLIGKAIGSMAIEEQVSEIVVGRDGRLSSPEFSRKLIEGLQSTGVNVTDIGDVTTGMMYFATHHLKTGSGVMVTGSHNPADYNGFKIMLNGMPVAGERITQLRDRISTRDFHQGSGGLQDVDISEEYIEEIASDVLVEDHLKVVIDCGNGIAGKYAPRLLEEIGCEVEPLYCEVDGEFPNHHPDPSDPNNLKDLILAVQNTGADLGLAMDGDGDRLGVITSEGVNIFADRILMLFARDVLSRNPGAAIIYDVKCTGELSKVILQQGGSPVMWKTGHSFIKQKMKEINAELAGEMSGHFFFKERWYGFDDAIYAAARLVEILAAQPEGATEALKALPDSVSTPELKVQMDEGAHYEFMDRFVEAASFDGARITTIDGIRADFEDGWGLVRCSNTTPCLVLRFDAVDEEALNRISDLFRAQLLAVDSTLELPF